MLDSSISERTDYGWVGVMHPTEGSWTWVTGESWNILFGMIKVPVLQMEIILNWLLNGTYLWNDNQDTDFWAVHV